MSDAEITIGPAAETDLPEVRALLGRCGLEDAVSDHWKTLLVAREGSAIIGCACAEAYQFSALIRTLAVDPEHRSRGLARKIVRQLIDRLASRGLREYYALVPPPLEEYFKKRGFKTIDQDEIHPQILASKFVQEKVDSGVVCMRLVMLG